MHACQLCKGQILKYLDPLVTSNRHPYNLVPVAPGAGLLQNAWVVVRVKIVLAGFGWSCSAFTATHRCVHALSGALTCCGGICTQHVRSFHDCIDLPPASHHKSLHLSTRTLSSLGTSASQPIPRRAVKWFGPALYRGTLQLRCSPSRSLLCVHIEPLSSPITCT